MSPTAPRGSSMAKPARAFSGRSSRSSGSSTPITATRSEPTSRLTTLTTWVDTALCAPVPGLLGSKDTGAASRGRRRLAATRGTLALVAQATRPLSPKARSVAPGTTTSGPMPATASAQRSGRAGA